MPYTPGRGLTDGQAGSPCTWSRRWELSLATSSTCCSTGLYCAKGCSDSRSSVVLFKHSYLSLWSRPSICSNNSIVSWVTECRAILNDFNKLHGELACESSVVQASSVMGELLLLCRLPSPVCISNPKPSGSMIGDDHIPDRAVQLLKQKYQVLSAQSTFSVI